MIKVEVNQIWIAPMMGGRVLRKIRILAPHPDGGWIYKLEYTIQPGIQHEGISRITELGLEKAYTLEKDVCTHRHTDDWYRDESPLPTHFRCTDCGDLFPNTGDDRFWFPKVLEHAAV